jgi:iron complex outermembrane receptor protein
MTQTSRLYSGRKTQPLIYGRHCRLQAFRASLLVAWACGWAATAEAQTAAAPTDRQDSGYLEEIVVTAQKKAENIQTVPFSVSAVTGDSLRTYQYKDLKDLNGTVPNVEFTQITNVSLNLAPSIRGIGSTSNPDPYTGTEVAVVVDGVVQGTRLLGLSDQFDVERIEVLRGPQGTLFGADTLGGVVNVVSRAPTGELGAYGNLTIGNYHELDGALAINFPIIKDVLAGKVSMSHRERDGFYTNLEDGQNLMWVDSTKVRGYLLFTPTADFKATLIVGNDHIRNGADVAANVSSPNEVFYVPGITTTAVRWGLYSAASAPNNANLNLYTLNTDWKTAAGKWTGIFNYTDFNAFNVQDVGEVPKFLLGAGRYPASRQYSGEIRDEFNPIQSVDMMLGLFYMKLHTNVNTLTLIPCCAPGIMTEQLVTSDQKSAAVFGQMYWDMTSQWRLGLGIRGTKIETELTSFNDTYSSAQPYSPVNYAGNLAQSTSIATFTVSGSDSWTEPGGKISLDYKFTPDVMGYAYYARGFKSGGFNGRITVPQDIGPFSPEFDNSYEVGVRSEWLDKRLRANAAVFYNKWDNMQVPTSIFTGNPPEASSTILNAAVATTKGAEIELEVAPTKEFDVRATVGYLSAAYDKFLSSGADYSGRATPYSPRWTGSLSGSYNFMVGSNSIKPSLQYTFVGDQWSNFTQAPAEFIHSAGLLKANIGFAPSQAKWGLSLWATNLLNKQYVVSSLDVPPLFSFATFGAPRQFGVDVHFDL